MLVTLIGGMAAFKNYFDVNIYRDLIPLAIIAASILVYNLFFHKLWKIDPQSFFKRFKIHGLRFALLQICADFIALMLFIYYTGGVESPMYAFFIFHVIIGSLFLPGRIVALLITAVLIITAGGSALELNGTIPHHPIGGWIEFELYKIPEFVFVFFLFFGLALYLSIYLTNSIAKQLYERERALTQAYDELENAEKTKSRYVMSVVHDLKTPIAAATTYLDMLLSETLGEIQKKQKRPLERAKYRLDRGINTINDILRISQIRISEDIDDVEDINIYSLLSEIYEDNKVLFRSKDLDAKIECDDCEQAVIQANHALLKLTFSNLISNAQKYTKKGGKIRIIISGGKDELSVVVADDGIGIPKEDKEKIFKEFYRTKASKKEGIEGSGLGMTIVKQIVERYGGKIEVESPSRLASGDDTPGSEFNIILPKNYIAF